MDVIPSKIDFLALMNESLESLRFMYDADQLKSIVDVSGEAPFYTDQSRLLIIFNNIISNAIRYRNRRKDSFLHIDIHVDYERVKIIFTDNGIGIANEFQDKIFKMFFRASYESKGSGLGLYIVKSTVEKLAGSITVQSELGEGTRFVIEIPNTFTPSSMN